ncbi:MAG: aldehyde dehydrogenase family protein [Flavobacteriales bacterium]|nr:aldehyde dehydrogenase family protein [Flavobacteriales bacterium]
MEEAVIEKAAPAVDYGQIVQKQRDYFWSGATKSLKFRKEQLRKLKAAFSKHERSLYDALKSDLNKHEQESMLSEIDVTVSEIEHILGNLEDWMQAERVATPLIMQPGSSKIISEPYGVTLIIAPWNYPVKNLFGPLLGAICAGNTAVVKPSEISPACSKAITEMLADTFAPEYIVSIEGGVPETTELPHSGYTRIGR